MITVTVSGVICIVGLRLTRDNPEVLMDDSTFKTMCMFILGEISVGSFLL